MHVLFVAMMAALGTAQATDCAWDDGGSPIVLATPTTITIDDRTWLVRGRNARAAFIRHLEDCGQAAAATEFVEWRRRKRFTNGTLIGGVLVPIVWLASPVVAVLARQQRDRLVRALGGDPGFGVVEGTLTLAMSPRQSGRCKSIQTGHAVAWPRFAAWVRAPSIAAT
ncbi:MAG: hypothetical protein VX265_07840 [Myxococcota bacterium]|nr:hypothetical protein [Myxococcota bacterium]MEC8425577.1 hypothetical protein [Myxococcota bacterium]